MANAKITALAAISQVAPATDVWPVVDISDTSMDATGTDKKATTDFMKYAALAGAQGLKMSWVSTTELAIAAGTIGVNGKQVSYAGATLTSGSTMKDIANVTVTLGNSAAYWVFISDAGVIGIEINDGTGDGAVPVFDTTYDYWKAASTGVAWRRIGKFWTSGAGALLYFVMRGSGRERKVSAGHGVLVLQSAGTSTTYAATTVFAPYYTTDDDTALVQVQASVSAGTNMNVYTSLSVDSGTTLLISAGVWCPSTGADNYGPAFRVPHSGTLHYKVSGTSARVNLNASGFEFTI